ncbi:MAG TPA: glycosyltransferase family 4 protein [Bacteroidetes bacterium]|nr:glycosyltransferase family 4 protein [Bacteroidota bacterium]
MKKILLLSDINSAHSKKWFKLLSQYGFSLAVYSLSLPEDGWYKKENIKLLSDGGFSNAKFHAKQSSKIAYLKRRKEVKKAIADYKPDIVHAHYASSYGLLGALSGFHPFYLSVWGSDVLLFPSNPINKSIIKFNFKKADKIIVSSKILKEESQRYTKKEISIIPFGVDTSIFKPSYKEKSDIIIIGTVKSLEKVYGIDLLIKAFSILVKKMPQTKIEMHIIGEGSEKASLEKMTKELGVDKQTRFLGTFSQQDLVKKMHDFDIGVFLSRSESFGVAILEVSACGIPVVVSAVGGLKEVVEDDKTGFWVETENPEAAAEKMKLLMKDKKLREQMGKKAREKVIKEYNLKDTEKEIVNLYESMEKKTCE